MHDKIVKFRIQNTRFDLHSVRAYSLSLQLYKTYLRILRFNIILNNSIVRGCYFDGSMSSSYRY